MRFVSVHDECHFWLNAYVNKQSMTLWFNRNPRVIAIWAAINLHGIFKPVLMQETVSSNNYHKLLMEMLIPELENWEHLKKAIFQQDGAKPHTSDANLLLLSNVFKKSVILN